MTIRKLQITALTLLAGLAIATIPAIAEETIDEDEQFTEALRDFGYAGGAAWQCAEAEARSDIERQAMVSYNGLARLFGTDEAFFFSTAFGAGTSAPIDKAECGEFSKQFQAGMSKAGVQ
jgi:hypothetical protein